MYTETLDFDRTLADLRSGQRNLLDFVAERCDRIDRVDPFLQALLPEARRRERLLGEAAALVERFPHPDRRPPLFGALVGVKDLLRVDGFPTRAGSALPAELFAGPEASCVTALRAAGALILGKTPTDEFAHSEPSPARNPHNPEHTPGGSSAGSAATVAAGYCHFALGTQTMRSIIGPAAFCGVVGFKPSRGSIATDGLVYMSPSIDTIGILAQSVRAVQKAAELLYLHEPLGWASARPVLGIPRGGFLNPLSDEARVAFDAQVSSLEAAGYDVREVPLPEIADGPQPCERASRLLQAEMARIHQDWFAAHSDRYRPRTAAAVRSGQAVTTSQETEALEFQPLLRNALAGAMDRAGVDLWVLPSSNGPAPKGLEVTGWADMTGLWSYANLPCLSLPASRSERGLPLGIQFVTRYRDDRRLLSWAAGLADDLAGAANASPAIEPRR